MKVYVVHGASDAYGDYGSKLNAEHSVHTTLDGAKEELKRVDKELMDEYADYIDEHYSGELSLYYSLFDGYIEYKIVECEVNK